MRIPATLALAFVLAGCGTVVHRIDIQQGNIVAPEAFVRIKPGMTKTEVRNVVGTPLLTDIFHANRWDYYFRYEQRGTVVEQNRFSVFFENEKVVRVEGGPTPSAAAPAKPSQAATPPAQQQAADAPPPARQP
jgi:outer membrane protein assembly factor BamE